MFVMHQGTVVAKAGKYVYKAPRIRSGKGWREYVYKAPRIRIRKLFCPVVCYTKTQKGYDKPSYV